MDLRPLSTDDIRAWALLLEASEVVDRSGEHYVAADLAEELANPDVEVGLDFLGWFERGELVGIVTVLPRGESDGDFHVALEGTVRPDHRGRGIGTELVTRGVRRAEEVARARRTDLPLRVSAHARGGHTGQHELFTGLGMTPRQDMFAMRTRLDSLPDPGPVPDGYDVVGYDATMDDSLRTAHNDAFDGDHPGFTRWTRTAWAHWVTGSRMFRPELTQVARLRDTGAIAGYVVTDEFEAHTAATGRREAHVDKVGTLRAHRGRGLASALLGRCLHAYAAAGFDDASLHVDAQNPSGALRVYERAGFEVTSTITTYALTTPAR